MITFQTSHLLSILKKYNPVVIVITFGVRRIDHIQKFLLYLIFSFIDLHQILGTRLRIEVKTFNNWHTFLTMQLSAITKCRQKQKNICSRCLCCCSWCSCCCWCCCYKCLRCCWCCCRWGICQTDFLAFLYVLWL